MDDPQFTGYGQFSAELSRLSQELIREQRTSQSEVLTHSLNRISTVEPFLATGIYSIVGNSGQCRWLNEDRESSLGRLLDQVLDDHSEHLAHAANGGNPVQLTLDDKNHCERRPRFFVGVAAGLIDDAPAGIGYLCHRALTETELVQLVPFSRLVGATLENARVNDLLSQAGERNPFAQLIGLIAHELRTPLTGMRGNIQLALMANRKGQHDRVPQRLQAAIDTVDQMSGLVRKLLDVSRLERGAYSFHDSLADLRITMLAAIEETRSQVEPEAYQISLADGAPVELLHDPAALKQCLSYLLQTIAQYTSASGKITVAVSQRPEDRQIEITYPGDALSSSDRSALSAPLDERYERSGYDLSSDELSLELAFSRGILRRYQGTISFDNREASPESQMITVTLRPIQS